MIKLIGAIMLICGTGAVGINGVLKLRDRCRTLEAVTLSLGALQSEICDRLTPMPQILSMLGEESEYPACELYKNAEKHLKELGNRSFSNIWSSALSETPQLGLSAPEETALRELGQSLGRYDTESQKNAIEYTRRKMESFTRRAEQVRDNNSKMHAVLGVASGVFAVVILI